MADKKITSTNAMLAALGNKASFNAEVKQDSAVINSTEKRASNVSSSQDIGKIVEGIGKSLADKGNFDLTPAS